METFHADRGRAKEYHFGAIVYCVKKRTLCSMLSTRAIRLTPQENAFLSFLAARMGAIAVPDALAQACAIDKEGKKRPDRHHLRVVVKRLRDKLEWVVPGTSRHMLTVFDGGGYALIETEGEVERLRSSDIYFAREDFQRQGLR